MSENDNMKHWVILYNRKNHVPWLEYKQLWLYAKLVPGRDKIFTRRGTRLVVC